MALDISMPHSVIGVDLDQRSNTYSVPHVELSKWIGRRLFFIKALRREATGLSR